MWSFSEVPRKFELPVYQELVLALCFPHLQSTRWTGSPGNAEGFPHCCGGSVLGIWNLPRISLTSHLSPSNAELGAWPFHPSPLSNLFLTTLASNWQNEKTVCHAEVLLLSWVEDDCCSLSLTCSLTSVLLLKIKCVHPGEAMWFVACIDLFTQALIDMPWLQGHFKTWA